MLYRSPIYQRCAFKSITLLFVVSFCMLLIVSLPSIEDLSTKRVLLISTEGLFIIYFLTSLTFYQYRITRCHIMKKYLYPYPKRKEIEIRNISFALITFTYEQFTTTFFIYSKENDKIRFETTNNYLGIAEVLDNLKIPIFIEDFEVQHCIDEVEKIRLYTELNVIKKKYSWRRSSDVRYIKNQIKNNDFKVLHRI